MNQSNKDQTKKRNSRLFSLVLAILMFVGALPLEALNIGSVAKAADANISATTSTGLTIGNVKNVTQTISNTDDLKEYCKRVLEGENWIKKKKPSSYKSSRKNSRKNSISNRDNRDTKHKCPL